MTDQVMVLHSWKKNPGTNGTPQNWAANVEIGRNGATTRCAS